MCNCTLGCLWERAVMQNSSYNISTNTMCGIMLQLLCFSQYLIQHHFRQLKYNRSSTCST